MIDLATEQDLTPASRQQVFLDSAGSSLPPRPVVDAVVDHLRREAEVGGYRAAAERAEELAGLPVSIARLLRTDADLVALSDSATRSWNQVVTAIDWRSGDRILICGNEYASNAIVLLQRARLDGVSVEVVPTGPDGDPDLAALTLLLDERVRLVSVVHVATSSGHVTDVRPIVDAAHRVGALVLLDACQSAGQIDLDVQALGVDALTATGRKWLRGPRGTGFGWIRRELLSTLEPRAADMRGATWTSPGSYTLRADAARFELWESDVAARLGLKAAVDHLLDLGPADVEAAIRSRATLLRDGLDVAAGVTVHDVGADLCGIVTFTVAGEDPAATKARLLDQGVTVSVSAAGSTLLDMTARGLTSVVRASPHYFVGPDQVEAAVGCITRR